MDDYKEALAYMCDLYKFGPTSDRTEKDHSLLVKHINRLHGDYKAILVDRLSGYTTSEIATRHNVPANYVSQITARMLCPLHSSLLKKWEVSKRYARSKHSSRRGRPRKESRRKNP